MNNDLLSHSSLSNIQGATPQILGCHVTSLNQGLCWSVLGREAEVESLACEVVRLVREFVHGTVCDL